MTRRRHKIVDGLNQAIGYTQGWNAAIDAAAKLAQNARNADIFKDVQIARDILALKIAGNGEEPRR